MHCPDYTALTTPVCDNHLCQKTSRARPLTGIHRDYCNNPYTGNNPGVPKSKQNPIGSSFAGLQQRLFCRRGVVAMFMLNLSPLAVLVISQQTAPRDLLPIVTISKTRYCTQTTHHMTFRINISKTSCPAASRLQNRSVHLLDDIIKKVIY